MKLFFTLFVAGVFGGAFGYLCSLIFPAPWDLLVSLAGGIVIGLNTFRLFPKD